MPYSENFWFGVFDRKQQNIKSHRKSMRENTKCYIQMYIKLYKNNKSNLSLKENICILMPSRSLNAQWFTRTDKSKNKHNFFL